LLIQSRSRVRTGGTREVMPERKACIETLTPTTSETGGIIKGKLLRNMEGWALAIIKKLRAIGEEEGECGGVAKNASIDRGPDSKKGWERRGGNRTWRTHDN